LQSTPCKGVLCRRRLCRMVYLKRMNKRDYKLSGAGEYFHVFNRGNNSQEIFLDKEDYNFFFLRVKQNLFPELPSKRLNPLPGNSFSLLSYCLMPNHFHFLVRQNANFKVQQLLLRICTSYSKYFNKKYNSVGHVFQDRFKQITVTGDRQILWLHAYINLNPVLDGYVDDPTKYAWSSYKELLGVRKGICDTQLFRNELHSKADVEGFMREALPVLKLNKELRYNGFD